MLLTFLVSKLSPIDIHIFQFICTGPEQVFRAKRIILRDDFSSTTINNDIALVQLDRPAMLNSRVGTVCLPRQGYQVPVGSQCITTGKRNDFVLFQVFFS